MPSSEWRELQDVQEDLDEPAMHRAYHDETRRDLAEGVYTLTVSARWQWGREVNVQDKRVEGVRTGRDDVDHHTDHHDDRRPDDDEHLHDNHHHRASTVPMEPHGRG